MKDIWKAIKPELIWLLAAGGAPCLGFILGVLFSFCLYPTEVEEASKTIMIAAGTGVLVGIFLIVHRIRQLLKK